jgi:hypothetical protein
LCAHPARPNDLSIVHGLADVSGTNLEKQKGPGLDPTPSVIAAAKMILTVTQQNPPAQATKKRG